MPQCENVFQLLKGLLKTLPPLAKPLQGDALSLYLSISPVTTMFK